MSRLSRHAGFSLAELTLVILIISVLAVFALPRFDSQAFDEAAFHQELISALRYGQKLAINSGCEIQVQVLAASNSFAVNRRSGGSAIACGTGAFTDPVLSPQGSGSLQGSAAPGVSVSSDFTVSFDSLGLPSSGGSLGVGGLTVTVEAGSGYVR
jgi:MSHA pilin protein MshC